MTQKHNAASPAGKDLDAANKESILLAGSGARGSCFDSITPRAGVKLDDAQSVCYRILMPMILTARRCGNRQVMNELCLLWGEWSKKQNGD